MPKRPPSERKLAAITALSGSDRYDHFVKVVADAEELWGLCSDGWALYGSDDGGEFLAVWPEAEYAAACAKGSWDEYKPCGIDVHEFLDAVLPDLESKGIGVAVFPTPSDKGVTPDIATLRQDVLEALRQYE